MNLKNILLNATNIILNKIIQLLGILIIIFGVFFFLSLLTYSPDDPNFIFTDSREIKNIFGFKGSLISDFFFQSIGLISFLIPFTLLFNGLNILINKKIIHLFENFFFIVLYSLTGSVYFSFFYQDSFYF